MKRPAYITKHPTAATGIPVICFAVFFTVALVTLWWRWYGESDWDTDIEDSGGWRSSETVVTLIDSGKTMRVSGWGQMANYGYIGCSGQYFPRPWDSVAPAITGLAIEKGVTVIGQKAFSDFGGLTSVTVPNGVFHIGEFAFSGCTGLTTVTIPRSVISCGETAWGMVMRGTFDDNVFSGCDSLTSINVSKWNSQFASVDGVLFDKAKKTLLRYPRGRQGAYAIPNGVTKIEKHAFRDCRGLTSVTIPNSVTHIEGWAFAGCTGLKSVTIPNRVAYILNGAFENSALKSVTIPKSAAYIAIGYEVFAGCDSLTSINADDGNPAYASVDGVLFNKAKDSLLVYPCGRQGAYTVPKSVAYIENSAFSGAAGLTSIMAAPDNAHFSSVDGVLFNKDKTVLIQYPEGKPDDSCTIPNSVTGIRKSEFKHFIRDWKKDGAFYPCRYLKAVTIPGGLAEIEIEEFLYCDNLTSINVAADNVNYHSIDGVLFDKDKTTLILYPRGRRQGAYTIPNSVAAIGDGAFYECGNLTSVAFGKSVASIGKKAFYECKNLTSVTLGGSVASIGNQAFFGCAGLTSITIPNGVESIGEWAFSCAGLTSITIPNSVNAIAERAFAGCDSLTTVTVQNPKPPQLGRDVFRHIGENACLYVPKGSIDAYRTAGGWKEFECIKDIIASARE
jgi:hypothetical protein